MKSIVVVCSLLLVLTSTTAMRTDRASNNVLGVQLVEERAVDDQALIRLARESESYGGAFRDQSTGKLVILLARSDARVKDAVDRSSDTAELRSVKMSESDLLAGGLKLWDSWTTIAPGVPLESIAIDSENNSLVVRVLGSYEAAKSSVAQFEFTSDAPVTVEIADGAAEAVCTSRDNCYSPYRAGIRIKQDSPPIATCTMGFHVVNPSGNIEATTAGHCGFTGTSNWYHLGNGFIGNRYGSLYPAPGGSGSRGISP